MISPSRRFFVAPIVAFLSIVTAQFAPAQSTNRQIGTQFTVTADPLVPRPHKKPCVVPLFSNFQFAFFSQTDQTFNFTPPSDCDGPWSKVVLEINFSENAGVQFDRTASLYVANTNLYFGTTPEPLQNDTNTWHVERDVTDYSALFTSGQTGTMVLQNCTTDCPPPFNTELNGVFTVSADLQFYPGEEHRDHDRQTETPDVILPLEQPNGSGGVSLPAILTSPTAQLSGTFTLPTNVERAYLDVVSQSQSNDEQWYACFPNDQSAINALFGCGNTDFRETEITIDGQPAGIAPVSPWVFTGFIPDQWIPTPAAQTLEFVPFRVNLTPFAALLSDGNPHTVAMSIFNDDNYFSVTGSLLLFLDKGSKQVTGALTKNTLTSPSPVESDNLQGTTTVTGTIGITQDRNFTIAGFVHTSHGKVETSITQKRKFASTSTIDFNLSTGNPLDQNTVVQNSVSTTTTVSNWLGELVTQENFSFPITVDVTFPVSSATFGFTVATSQKYHADKQISIGPFPIYFNSTTNAVSSTDVSPLNSSQKYSYFDSNGAFYECHIASKNNTLTSVSDGCNPDEH
jgi:Peptide N-acetyl-beta-D-glucosaminyl asparaginase amidase A